MLITTIMLLIINLLGMLAFYIFLRSNFSQNNYLKNMKTEVEKLIKDIEFHSERCITLIDDRIKTSQQILKDVDSHINIANKELKSQKKEVVVLEKLMDKNTEKVRKNSQSKNKDEIQIYSKMLKDKGINPDHIKLELNSKKERVLEMHKEGFPKDIIAKKMGIHFGEVELIIMLEN